jgi:hypothetical protein
MDKKLNKELLIIQLNEMNFDYANYYIEKYNLKNLKKIIEYDNCVTNSENEYEKLEPWIQWVTFNTGKSADQHEVFRLGGAEKLKFKQIYERVEELGLSVGAISPMNTINKLKNPNFFISDPWTNTSGDKNYLHNLLSKCLSKVINNNSQKKIGFVNYCIIIISIISFVRVKKYKYLLKLILSINKKSWYRVFILELLLHEIYLKCLKKNKTNFSSIFFNGIAHIQHHYFFNAENYKGEKNPNWYLAEHEDPFKETLIFYDYILQDYFKLKKDLLIVTGLTQIPYNIKKYYYRLKTPSKFLSLLNLKHKCVKTRMTRDFLIEFSDTEDAEKAFLSLSSIVDRQNIRIFNELDLKDKSLFVTLTYPHEINENFEITVGKKNFLFKKYISFVALKNGMHSSKGFVFTNVQNFLENRKTIELKDFYKKIENYFLK